MCPKRPSQRKIATPRSGTAAARDFFVSWTRINSLFHFILFSVSHIDKTATIAHEALLDTARSEEARCELTSAWEARKPAVEYLKKHRQVFLEIIFSRHIENYLSYLSSLLFEIFTQRPETLRSSGTIDVETALNQGSMSELVRAIAKKRVESLSYSSFEDLAAYFGTKFHLVLVEKASLAQVVEAVEIRNISVHNRCIVNERFVARTHTTSTNVGEVRQLYIEDLDRLIPLLAGAVRKLDRSAREHLELKGIRFDVDKITDESGPRLDTVNENGKGHAHF